MGTTNRTSGAHPTRTRPIRPSSPTTVDPHRKGEQRLGAVTFGCSQMFDQLPQVLAVTHWGQAEGRPIPIRITGWRTGAADNMATRFERLATVPSLPAGSGRFGYTVSVPNLPGGDWEVRTERTGVRRTGQRPQRCVVRTRPAQLAYGPAVKVWSWPALVLAGAALAIVVQALLLARTNANVAAGLIVSVGSCLVGFAGAKAWYLVSAGKPIRRFLSGGACIQGFLLAALTTLAIGGALTGIGAGELLDATTPGLFLGMAVGRPGCFFTGCCAGRPTASRWGLWSSDRTIAARRIPVQLWEATAALAIALTSLAVVLLGGLPIAGAVFVAAIATYTGVRQLLFPLRADPHTRRGRYVTLAICVVLLVADLAAVAAAG
ncbi:prolipoprotein diacylglyceryl transferase family protein [Mycolicibacterium tusciae]|uniref:prolipoprotein diacylglyceryl transferase family protein n=1 Tax=Mycolicibacterium tusciae TaxID=75922 RepID=UPI0002F1580B|nr:prolipoprotein diacylglyceryl transferase family protein [Mycolicibacterium tusciae]